MKCKESRKSERARGRAYAAPILKKHQSLRRIAGLPNGTGHTNG